MTSPAQDTDSVMCILNLGEDKRYDMAAHFEAAEKLADAISKTFPPPVELEFEKGEQIRVSGRYGCWCCAGRTAFERC